MADTEKESTPTIAIEKQEITPKLFRQTLLSLGKSESTYILRSRLIVLMDALEPILAKIDIKEKALTDFSMKSWQDEVDSKKQGKLENNFSRSKEAQVKLALALWRQAFYKQFAIDASLSITGFISIDLVKQPSEKGLEAFQQMVKQLKIFIKLLMDQGLIHEPLEILQFVDLSEIAALDLIAFAELLGLPTSKESLGVQETTRSALLGEYGKKREHSESYVKPSEEFDGQPAIIKAMVMALAPETPGVKHSESAGVKSVLTEVEEEHDLNEIEASAFVSLARLFISRSFHKDGSLTYIYNQNQDLSFIEMSRWLKHFFLEAEAPFEILPHERDMVAYLKFVYHHHEVIFNRVIQELVSILINSMHDVEFEEVGAEQRVNQILTRKIIEYLQKPMGTQLLRSL